MPSYHENCLKHATFLLLQLLRIRLTLRPQPPETLLHLRLQLRLRQPITEETTLTSRRPMPTRL